MSDYNFNFVFLLSLICLFILKPPILQSDGKYIYFEVLVYNACVYPGPTWLRAIHGLIKPQLWLSRSVQMYHKVLSNFATLILYTKCKNECMKLFYSKDTLQSFGRSQTFTNCHSPILWKVIFQH